MKTQTKYEKYMKNINIVQCNRIHVIWSKQLTKLQPRKQLFCIVITVKWLLDSTTILSTTHNNTR